MIFEKPPSDFNPTLDVVACYVLCGEKFLAMQYCDRKGGEWGVLGGKRESHETRDEAIIREIKEESGFKVLPSQLKKSITFPIRYPNFDFWYTIYSIRIDNKRVPKLDLNEHQAFKWVTPTEALKLNLMLDEPECVKYFFYNEFPY